MMYLEFISMVRILLEQESWNMLSFQREGNHVLKERTIWQSNLIKVATNLF